MKQKELESNLRTLSESELQIVLRYIRLCCFRHQIMKALYRFDLWLFPPFAFIANYFWMSSFVPEHPIAKLTILTSSFMSATLTLFLIRPPKKMFPAHWI